VQELAALPLFAQATQPMLAYQIIEIRVAVCRGVSVGAFGPQRAVALKVCLARRAVRRDAMAIVLQQKRREGEAVFGGLML